MAVRPAFWAFLAAAALAITGFVLGAGLQEEGILYREQDQLRAAQGATGTLVILTAMLVATGITAAGLTLTRLPRRRALAPSAAVWGSSWLLTILFQMYTLSASALSEFRIASLSLGHLILEADGSPSVLVPLLALMVAGAIGLGWGLFRLAGHRSTDIHSGLVGSTLLATPFLLAAAVGSIEVLLAVPDSDVSSGLASVLLPINAAACLALLATAIWRLWILGEHTADPSLAPSIRETWRILDRVQWVAAGVLVAVAALSTALPARDLDATGLGGHFILGLRAHGQLMVLLLVPLAAVWWHQRRIPDATLRFERALPGARPGFPVTVLVAVCVAGLMMLAFAFTRFALLPWIVATTALALYAFRWPALWAAPVQILAAWLLWARGDTLVAAYDGNVFPPLSFETAPAVLALWRIASAALLAASLGRLAQAAGQAGPQPVRRSTATALALAVGLGAALVILLEGPLAIWVVQGGNSDTLSVGALVVSQSGPVRAIMHLVAIAASLGGATAGARLLRPDWFRRRPEAMPTTRAAPQPRPEPARHGP